MGSESVSPNQCRGMGKRVGGSVLWQVPEPVLLSRLLRSGRKQRSELEIVGFQRPFWTEAASVSFFPLNVHSSEFDPQLP